ncbi:nuclease Le1 [Clavulina sp. PMI_390]|nr:nuclease Le1 [Clavulina sp. PMI_390]
MLAPFQLIASTLLLTYGASVHAWGESGHEVVGYVAQAFLGPETLSFIQDTLDPSYRGQLGRAGNWADTVKSKKEWAWTRPLHYINAHDDPLNGMCSVSDSRDCEDHCILTALTNYTSRIADPTLSVSERNIALKFLIHFIGDVGQPLHIEEYQRGGNEIKTRFDGANTNLHAVWDSSIPEKTIKLSHSNSITTYASDLIDRIKIGSYSSEAESWINCTNPTLPQGRDIEFKEPPQLLLSEPHRGLPLLASASTTDLECPLEWAKDSNTYMCSTVLSGYTASNLGTAYYQKNAPIVDLQIAKSGYRLAAWLNSIFEGSLLH